MIDRDVSLIGKGKTDRVLTDDDAAALSRLAAVLETGHAYNGIADDNAKIYAESLRRALGLLGETEGDGS